MSTIVINDPGRLQNRTVRSRVAARGWWIWGAIIAVMLACAALGSKITVVELMDSLIPGADKDVVRVLAKRIENFKKIRDNISSVEDRLKQLEKLEQALESQRKVLARIKYSLDGESEPEPDPATKTVVEQPVAQVA